MRRLLLLIALAALLAPAAPSRDDAHVAVVRAPALGLQLAVQDDEVAQAQQMLSKRREWTRPAPRVWSSRHDVRWSARWQAAPRYAV